MSYWTEGTLRHRHGGHCHAEASAWRYIQFVPLKTRSDGSDSVAISEIKLRCAGHDIDMRGASAINPHGLNPRHEEPFRAIDNRDFTKWLDFSKGSLVIELADMHYPDSFRFRTANDEPGR